MPRLSIQVSVPIVAGGGGQIRVRVENTGGGFASEVWFWVHEGNFVALGGLPPHGALGPGKGSTVKTQLQPTKGQQFGEALVIWKYGKKLYAQAGAPAHNKSWSRRKWALWAPKNNEEVVQRFFPNAGDIRSWHLVRSELESES